jgi:hypothetical protein
MTILRRESSRTPPLPCKTIVTSNTAAMSRGGKNSLRNVASNVTAVPGAVGQGGRV